MAKVREKQKQETRDALLEAARLLFEERGFRKTTVKQVAERAGVAVGTVFVHFPDKSSLLAASLHESIERVVEEAFDTLPQQGDVVESLLHFAECLYSWYRQDAELSKHLLKEGLFLGGEWGGRFRSLSEVFVMRLAGLIEEAKTQGELAPDLDSFMAALGFFSSYFTALLGVVMEPETPLSFHMKMLERATRFQLRLPLEPMEFPIGEKGAHDE
ncbi:MAG: TetR family transcriptional regulator [Deltaproteobacteria bacterium]|nr:TetR family transcriptional regulator [Deltaproteobacteria bacterium]|tara:strand:- start:13086 stop:13730 length:645 start_codon:yes stop_codon:yes gene_type:complete